MTTKKIIELPEELRRLIGYARTDNRCARRVHLSRTKRMTELSDVDPLNYGVFYSNGNGTVFYASDNKYFPRISRNKDSTIIGLIHNTRGVVYAFGATKPLNTEQRATEQRIICSELEIILDKKNNYPPFMSTIDYNNHKDLFSRLKERYPRCEVLAQDIEAMKKFIEEKRAVKDMFTRNKKRLYLLEPTKVGRPLEHWR